MILTHRCVACRYVYDYIGGNHDQIFKELLATICTFAVTTLWLGPCELVYIWSFFNCFGLNFELWVAKLFSFPPLSTIEVRNDKANTKAPRHVWAWMKILALNNNLYLIHLKKKINYLVKYFCILTQTQESINILSSHLVTGYRISSSSMIVYSWYLMSTDFKSLYHTLWKLRNGLRIVCIWSLFPRALLVSLLFPPTPQLVTADFCRSLSLALPEFSSCLKEVLPSHCCQVILRGYYLILFNVVPFIIKGSELAVNK